MNEESKTQSAPDSAPNVGAEHSDRAAVANAGGHSLYEPGDDDVPDVVKNPQGEIVLGLCRKCGRGEADLTEPCTPGAAPAGLDIGAMVNRFLGWPLPDGLTTGMERPIGTHLMNADQARAMFEHCLKDVVRPSDDDLWEQTLRDRDTNAEWADKLAAAIAKHFGVDIGEHSNMNCPWSEALDAIEYADRAPATSAAGLDEAAAYRFWRDSMLAEDESFVESVITALPGGRSDAPPSAAEWNAAIAAVMRDRATAKGAVGQDGAPC